MKIGILQTGHVLESLLEKHGEFSDMFKTLLDGHGFEFATYNVVDGEFPQSINEVDGWLITGSAHGVYEEHDWIKQLEDFLVEAYEADVAIVGICFGHQILAKALGGKVEKFGDGWAIGNQTYDMPDGEKTRNIIAWHQDQVTELPEGACEVGTSDFCKNAFIVYQRNAYSIQAHPEFSADFCADLTEVRKQALPEDLVNESQQSLDKPLDTQNMAHRIAEFFKSRQLEK